MKKVIILQKMLCVGDEVINNASSIFNSHNIETIYIPTSLSSSIEEFVYRDLTDTIQPIIRSFEQENIQPDAIYIGALDSIDQIDIAKTLFNVLGKESLKIVVPSLKSDDIYLEKMKELILQADIIMPNIQEACALLNKEQLTNYSKQNIHQLLKDLIELGCTRVILRDINIENEMVSYSYDKEKNSFIKYKNINNNLSSSFILCVELLKEN